MVRTPQYLVLVDASSSKSDILLENQDSIDFAIVLYFFFSELAVFPCIYKYMSN